MMILSGHIVTALQKADRRVKQRNLHNGVSIIEGTLVTFSRAELPWLEWQLKYRQVSNIRRTLVGN